MSELTAGMVISRDHIVISDFNFAKPLTIGLLASRAKHNGLVVTGFEGPLATFLSRIGYFSFLGVLDPFHLHRRNNLGTLEITDASNDFCPEIDQVYDQVRTLLHGYPNLRSIEQVLAELITNIKLHSEGLGLVVGQVIREVFILAVVDNGVGVRRALSIDPKYAHMDERQLIELSVQKGVGNGRGRGWGLWIASEIAKRGNGNILVGSGNYVHSTDARGTFRIPHWQGTFIEWKFNLGAPVINWTPGQDDASEVRNDENDFFS